MTQNLVFFVEREKQQKQLAMSDAVAQLMTCVRRIAGADTATAAADAATAADVAAHLTATAGHLASTTDR